MEAMRDAADQGKRSPGRPRCAGVDQSITDAVIDLLMDGTAVDAISMESVAARAGVGKATIYRRWQHKDELIADAVATLKPPPPRTAGRSVHEDLITLLRVAGSVPGRSTDAVLACLVPMLRRDARINDLYQAAVELRRQAMREVLLRGIDRGELRADLDIEITVALLTSPIVVQKLLRWNPAIDVETMPERIVYTVLAGVASSPAGAVARSPSQDAAGVS